jgi:hypothetical protein
LIFATVALSDFMISFAAGTSPGWSTAHRCSIASSSDFTSSIVWAMAGEASTRDSKTASLRRMGPPPP